MQNKDTKFYEFDSETMCTGENATKYQCKMEGLFSSLYFLYSLKYITFVIRKKSVLLVFILTY